MQLIRYSSCAVPPNTYHHLFFWRHSVHCNRTKNTSQITVICYIHHPYYGTLKMAWFSLISVKFRSWKYDRGNKSLRVNSYDIQTASLLQPTTLKCFKLFGHGWKCLFFGTWFNLHDNFITFFVIGKPLRNVSSTSKLPERRRQNYLSTVSLNSASWSQITLFFFYRPDQHLSRWRNVIAKNSEFFKVLRSPSRSYSKCE